MVVGPKSKLKTLTNVLIGQFVPGGSSFPSHWRHNGRDSVSSHQSHDCLLNRALWDICLRYCGICETGHVWDGTRVRWNMCMTLAGVHGLKKLSPGSGLKYQMWLAGEHEYFVKRLAATQFQKPEITCGSRCIRVIAALGLLCRLSPRIDCYTVSMHSSNSYMGRASVSGLRNNGGNSRRGTQCIAAYIKCTTAVVIPQFLFKLVSDTRGEACQS